MTMSVKLPFELEQQLRRRGAASGKPASASIREALALCFASNEDGELSAYALGENVFGRHSGSADLATSRKGAAADVWQARRAR